LDRGGSLMAAVEKNMTGWQYVVRLPADLEAALKARAEKEDRPISRIIRQAIREHLERWPEGRP
jgi:predicted transcriptional regulator